MTRHRDLDKETEILEYLEDNHTYRETQEKFGISAMQLSRIKKRWDKDNVSTNTNKKTNNKDPIANTNINFSENSDIVSTNTNKKQNANTNIIEKDPEIEDVLLDDLLKDESPDESFIISISKGEIKYEVLRAIWMLYSGEISGKVKKMKKDQLAKLVKEKLSVPGNFGIFLKNVAKTLEMI